MKGTVLDFLKLANERPELANELVQLAAKYDFEFSDEVSDEQLDDVAGGMFPASQNLAGMSLAFPDVCKTPGTPTPIPTPYPNIDGSEVVGTKVTIDGGAVGTKDDGTAG